MDEIHCIPAVCITLDHTNENRALKAKKDILRLGFNSCKFVTAVNGYNLSENQIRNITTVRSFYELIQGRYVHEALSGKGSIGCYLSHLKCWNLCLQENREYAIFEDDFSAIEGAREILKKVYTAAVKQRYNILRLSNVSNRDFESTEKLNDDLIIVNRTQNGSAYIITPRAAEILIRTALPIEMQLDHYIDMCSQVNDLAHLASSVSLYKDTHSPSTINHNQLLFYPDTLTADSLKRRYKYLILIGVLLLIIFLLVTKKCKRK